MSKKLIINADDYGICREVNEAIENLIKSGKLHNVSVLVNSWFYEEAVSFLSKQPNFSVGIHLNIVEGIALLPTDKIKILIGKNGHLVNLKQLLLRWIHSPIAVSKAIELEWRGQIELLLKEGLTISHADSHQHIHAFPPFWRILVKLCKEYGIPGVRFPRERNRIPLRSVSAFALEQFANISKTLFSKPNLVTNEHFLGFKRAGFYGEDEMISDLRNLKDGVTELIIHPSLYNGVPYPNLRGELEYKALLSSGLWKEIEELGIELITWADFSKTEISKIEK